MILHVDEPLRRPVFIESSDTSTVTVAVSPTRDFQVWDSSSRRVEPNSLLVEWVSTDFLSLLTDTDYLFKHISKITEEGSGPGTETEQVSLGKSKQDELDQRNRERVHLQVVRPSEYLRLKVFPALAQGLVQIEKSRPEDPLAFLATFLLEGRARGTPL